MAGRWAAPRRRGDSARRVLSCRWVEQLACLLCTEFELPTASPPTPTAFDAYYVATHVPLVKQIPGLREFYASHGDSPDGNSPAAYFQAELVFDSGTDAQAGLDSTQGQAAVADVPNFASGGATLSFVADEIVYRS